jgi:hypothetical protein
MLTPSRSRLDVWLPTVLLVVGTLVFFVGGGRHPHVNANSGMATPGSDEFFRQFARMIVDRPSWERFHTLILLGPVLWALAAAGVVRCLPSRVAALADVGRTALVLGAALWALAFVFDGYVGPRYARAVIDAGPTADAVALATFGANAFTMARIGMLSVALLGTAVLTFGAALVFDLRTRPWSATVGALGVLLGAWPLIATLRGDFSPGPFTTLYWTPLAVALGAWFLLLATTLPGSRVATAPAATGAGA